MTYGRAFASQPFGTSLVTMTLTGAQLLELLKQQWCGREAAADPAAVAERALRVERRDGRGDPGRAVRRRPEPGVALAIAGAPVDGGRRYRVAVSSLAARRLQPASTRWRERRRPR